MSLYPEKVKLEDIFQGEKGGHFKSSSINLNHISKTKSLNLHLLIFIFIIYHQHLLHYNTFKKLLYLNNTLRLHLVA